MGTFPSRQQEDMGNCLKNSQTPLTKSDEEINKSNASVTMDILDVHAIRLRAESVQSESSTGPGKALVNINCVKNGKTVSIILLPHQHTLFCERKQRVCTAAGKVQEMEVLQVLGLDLPLENCVWIRTEPGSSHTSAYSAIPYSENKIEYTLSPDDIGCYISFRHAYIDETCKGSSVGSGRDSNISPRPTTTSPPPGSLGGVTIVQAEHALGPVIAGPARLFDLRIVASETDNVKDFSSNSNSSTTYGKVPGSGANDPLITGESVRKDESDISGDLRVGHYAIAQVNYIGGKQGLSEFWWLKTYPDGRREQLTQPTHIPTEGHTDVKDPRIYKIKPEDLGCTLKVKCLPKRIDGYSGEVCTSKPSKAIMDDIQHTPGHGVLMAQPDEECI